MYGGTIRQLGYEDFLMNDEEFFFPFTPTLQIPKTPSAKGRRIIIPGYVVVLFRQVGE